MGCIYKRFWVRTLTKARVLFLPLKWRLLKIWGCIVDVYILFLLFCFQIIFKANHVSITQ